MFSLFIVSSVLASSAQTASSAPDASAAKQQAILKETGANEQHLALCEEQGFSFNKESRLKQCLLDAVNTEYIEVTGRYIGLEVPEIQGRYYLDRQFIQYAPQTNGDINELIALLPGVEMSEDAYSLDSLSEIKAQEISISGGQPWQTGFFIDGMNYNSRIDPAASDRSVKAVDDVAGSAQTMNVNTHIVEGITVYDNNIPAEYGHFSGGVVEVETVNAVEQLSDTQFNIGFRGTSTDLTQYHIITAEGDSKATQDIDPPQFEKQNYSFTASHKFNRQHGVMISANYLNSVISDISLSETKNQKRENINLLAKYSYRDGWIDKLDASVIYAPYKNHNFLNDVLDSDFTIEGGATGATIKAKHQFDSGDLSIDINGSHSSNSREAPPHYYVWLQAKGKEWGQYADQSEDATPVSLEGGYGNLDKTQTTFTTRSKFQFNDFKFVGIQHRTYVGAQFEYEQTRRQREIDNYIYNSAVQYSTSPNATPLNCSGYTLDCVAVSYAIPLADLAEQLGGEIDFNNIEHIQAYSDNVLVTPQYFQTRLVKPQEDIDVDLMRYALYATDSFDVEDLSVSLGARVDYDDIFENINLAPRLSLNYDLFGDGSTATILGLNRYYDVGILTYRIRQEQIPSYLQYRTIQDGYLQNWLDSSYVADYRYRFSDLSTPYDDELVLAWKQSLNEWGTWSIKYVHRDKKDQLARNDEAIKESDGYSYIEMNNKGYGSSERISLSWNGQFGGHGLWFNVSHQANSASVSGYDGNTDNVALDDLVIYEGDVMAKNDLELIKANFGRPLTGSFGWSYEWDEQLTLVATGTYSSSYTTAVSTSSYGDSGDVIKACFSCEATSVLLPVYSKYEVKARVMLSLGINWEWQVSDNQALSVDIDINNLLNQRTYSVGPDTSGIEPGRQLWIGLNYAFR